MLKTGQNGEKFAKLYFMKNVLIVAAGSDIAKSLINLLLPFCNVFATYRKNILKGSLSIKGGGNFTPLFLDVCDEQSFEKLTESIQGVKFDAVINFAGLAITSPVVKLSAQDLTRQLETCVVGLSRLLKNIYPHLSKDSRVINVSSVAAFGIFPFISPYCLSKAGADILLNAFEIETGIRTVSIKPGVVGTKFWQYCIDLNKDNFKNFDGEYKEAGEFLLQNAKDNAKKGVSPDDVARVVKKAICAKYPRHSYLIGRDAYFAAFSSFIPRGILNFIIRKTLNFRIRKFIDGK